MKPNKAAIKAAVSVYQMLPEHLLHELKQPYIDDMADALQAAYDAQFGNGTLYREIANGVDGHYHDIGLVCRCGLDCTEAWERLTVPVGGGQ